jgi:aryl-alcohol dehydrogenase-like predicted oxidoreductase
MTSKYDRPRRNFMKAAGLGMAGLAIGAADPTARQTEKEPGGIPKRLFGTKTGLLIPEVVFGAGALTQDSAKVLRAGLASGMSMIETSWMYTGGNSERTIGEVIQSVDRGAIILLTKASTLKHEELLKSSVSEVEKAVRGRLEDSLKRMKTEFIDCYIVPHAAKNPEEVDYPQLREVVEKLKAEGKIRFFGVSVHGDYRALSMRAIESGWHDFIMAPLALTCVDPDIRERGNRFSKPPRYHDMSGIAEKAQAAGLGVLAMKCAKWMPPYEVGADLKKKYPAAPQGISHHQLCYRAALDDPCVSAVTVSLSSMQHLQEALQLPGIKLAG